MTELDISVKYGGMSSPPPPIGTFAICGEADLTPHQLSLRAGSEIGASEWHTVSQRELDLFAEATHVGGLWGDHSGGSVAPPHLALALAPRFIPQVFAFSGFRSGVNYGCNRVRFRSNLVVGDRVRGAFTLHAVTMLDTGCRVVLNLAIEVEAADRPVCDAEILLQYFT